MFSVSLGTAVIPRAGEMKNTDYANNFFGGVAGNLVPRALFPKPGKSALGTRRNLRGIKPSNYANLLKQKKRLHKKRVQVVHGRTDKHTDKVLQTV